MKFDLYNAFVFLQTVQSQIRTTKKKSFPLHKYHDVYSEGRIAYLHDNMR